MREVTVRFSVSGYVTQTIEVEDHITDEKLVKGLNSGRFATSIQEGGEVIDFSVVNMASLSHEELTRQEVIGKVVNVDNNCEYENFEIEGNE